jgi:hypothetical protein
MSFTMNIDFNRPLGFFMGGHGLAEKTSTEDLLILSNLAFLSTEWLTPLSSLLGAAFISMTLLVSSVVAPLFANWLEDYRESTLVPEASKAMNIATSILLSKTICYAFGYNVTFKEIIQITASFLLSVVVLKYAIKKLNSLKDQIQA